MFFFLTHMTNIDNILMTQKHTEASLQLITMTHSLRFVHMFSVHTAKQRLVAKKSKIEENLEVEN